MPSQKPEPRSSNFQPLLFEGNMAWSDLTAGHISKKMQAVVEQSPRGEKVFWGLSFIIGENPVLLTEGKPAFTTHFSPRKAQWLVFAHTSDVRPLKTNAAGFISPTHGVGCLGEIAAAYIMNYADGTQVKAAIKRRHQLGMFQRRWGENCVEAVAHGKPHTIRGAHEQPGPAWGFSQTRVQINDMHDWTNWLWAWENPYPERELVSIRFEPKLGTVIISGISAGQATSYPTRWQSRHKALLTLPSGVTFDPTLDKDGYLKHIQLDMGTVISAAPQTVYPNKKWEQTYNNMLPQVSGQKILIEYTAHPDAHFHIPGNATIPVALLKKQPTKDALQIIPPANRLVYIKVIDKTSQQPVPVKLHIHGESGEYLAPNDRHRIPNPCWFEDYSPEFLHKGIHVCAYISGETRVKLPLGKVYLEISKGFEIRPVRKIFEVSAKTEEIIIEIEKVLPWRQRNWVSADTHVHFLSPRTGLLEGAAEGVNIVNLLASHWGELMTNVGDFDGETTYGSKEAGGDGEYLLRVGTENRQHVLGHISLLGYNGQMITPMCSGGADEAALGDPIEVLLTEWARQCKAQNGVVVIPHFPNPRLENAATIIEGAADAVEMTAWEELYLGIDPYSLSDWYRYLNNGYQVAAVGGTDKMSATIAVGTVRTYAHIPPTQEFSFDAWKEAIRRGETFVTYGPLLEFSVDGHPMGSRFSMSRTGGTVDVTWQVASVTVPMRRIELVANGEIIESRAVNAEKDAGHFSVKIEKCTWLALLVRGHYADKPEIITAHSSPVMIDVAGTEFYNSIDALTILNQIEGSLAYLDTVGTRAETAAYQRMRLTLSAAHRKLHNRMHQDGVFHNHSVTADHKEHH